MARKTATVNISANNRDRDKKFIITEMSAWDAWDWASRVFFALLNAGAEIPDGMMQAGLAGLAAAGGADFTRFVFSLLAKVPHYAAKPILDDLMKCVRMQPGDNPQITVALGELKDDIEEISTILLLQKEAFRLHFDFFGAGGQSITASESRETAA